MTMGEEKTAFQKKQVLTMINAELPKDVWQQKEAKAYVSDKKLVRP